MRTAQIPLQNNVDISVDQTSKSQDIEQIFSYAVQCTFTGASPLGTLSIQISIDNVNFADAPATSTAISATGTFVFNIPDAAYQYFRVKFVHTGGSVGNMTSLCFIKGF